MTIFYFGEHWDVPALEDARQAVTPIGEPCLDCGEPIAENDQGWIRMVLHGDQCACPEPIHRECELLGVIGHLYGICPCTGHVHGRAAALKLWDRIEALKAK